MQMEKVQASQYTKQAALQAAIDSLQERSKLLHSRHQQWGWKLAFLMHWKRQGALQLRRVLHSWARLSAASRSHPEPASRKHFARNSCEASDTEGDSVIEACPGTYLTADQDVEEARCRARLGLEDSVDGICVVTDHHDRRLLGVCFRGNRACQLVSTSCGPWFLCLASAASVPRVPLLQREACICVAFFADALAAASSIHVAACVDLCRFMLTPGTHNSLTVVLAAQAGCLCCSSQLLHTVA